MKLSLTKVLATSAVALSAGVAVINVASAAAPAPSRHQASPIATSIIDGGPEDGGGPFSDQYVPRQ